MIEKQTLERCVEKGMSIADISKYVNYGKTNVSYWLKKYNLKTKNLQYNRGVDNKKYISLNCAKCGTQFQKRLKIYNMEAKRNSNRKFYCSAECAGQTIDELSPFRKSYNGAKRRAKTHGREFNITTEYIKQLWSDQNQTCAISGLKMIKPEYQRHDSRVRNRTPYAGSLDRIDSSKGYVKGNVQWVCTFVNYAKNNFSDVDIKEAFAKIKQK